MKLSILDQSPVSIGKTQQEALYESIELAQACDRIGYHRYWMAEHHNMEGLACSAPEIMLSVIGSKTERIRIGSGALLLPYYRPFKAAETFNMLASLFPGRVDIGIGRAPGGSAEVSMALSDHYLKKVWNMQELTRELRLFLTDSHPSDHMFSKIAPSPVPVIKPEMWVLGTSVKSAELAGSNGAAFAAGHFLNGEAGLESIRTYRQSFSETGLVKEPSVLAAVSVICGETSSEAEKLAERVFAWQKYDSKEEWMNKLILGTPDQVKKKLEYLGDRYGIQEFMLLNNLPSLEERLRMFRLLAALID